MFLLPCWIINGSATGKKNCPRPKQLSGHLSLKQFLSMVHLAEGLLDLLAKPLPDCWGHTQILQILWPGPALPKWPPCSCASSLLPVHAQKVGLLSPSYRCGKLKEQQQDTNMKRDQLLPPAQFQFSYSQAMLAGSWPWSLLGVVPKRQLERHAAAMQVRVVVFPSHGACVSKGSAISRFWNESLFVYGGGTRSHLNHTPVAQSSKGKSIAIDLLSRLRNFPNFGGRQARSPSHSSAWTGTNLVWMGWGSQLLKCFGQFLCQAGPCPWHWHGLLPQPPSHRQVLLHSCHSRLPQKTYCLECVPQSPPPLLRVALPLRLHAVLVTPHQYMQ